MNYQQKIITKQSAIIHLHDVIKDTKMQTTAKSKIKLMTGWQHKIYEKMKKRMQQSGNFDLCLKVNRGI